MIPRWLCDAVLLHRIPLVKDSKAGFSLMPAQVLFCFMFLGTRPLHVPAICAGQSSEAQRHTFKVYSRLPIAAAVHQPTHAVPCMSHLEERLLPT